VPIQDSMPPSQPSFDSRTTATPDGSKGCCDAFCCDQRVGSGEVEKREPQSRKMTVPTAKEVPIRLDVEFLFLDLSSCDRCRQTEGQLTQALHELRPVLETEGISPVIHHIHIGHDIQTDWKATPCAPCEGLCGTGEAVRCREWWYRGSWYSAPPKGLLFKAILQEVYDRKLSTSPLPGHACC